MTVEYYKPNLEPKIQVSEAAKMRLLTVIANTPSACAMRLAIKKTGCSGYSYDLQTISSIVEGDLVLSLDPNLQLYIEPKSYELIKGLQIDYVKQGIQAKFIYTNPQQTGQCGCGESFTIEK
jgi:iron-sulfur cluster assembly protein